MKDSKDNVSSFFVILFGHFRFFPTFAKSCSETSVARERMKRESGESPEQSRCCEPHLYGLSLLTSPPLPNLRWEGKVNRGKSEDLQDRSHASCFRGKSVKNVQCITN